MIGSLDDLLKSLSDYFDELFNRKVASSQFNIGAYSTDLAQFSSQYLKSYDGDEPILQSTFREFLDFQQKSLDYRFNNTAQLSLSTIKFITANPTKSVSVGEIPAVAQNLVLTGTGVLPTISTDPSLVPSDGLFNYHSNIVKGQIAYNSDDDIWYYRANSGIKKLVDLSALSQYATTSDLNTQKSRIDTLNGTVTTLNTTVSQTATAITLLASQSSLNTLTGRVTSAETSITQNTNAITLLATQSSVNALGVTVASHTTSIALNASQIALKASQSSLDALTGRMTSAETSITQTAIQIASLATSANINTLTGEITTLQSSITQQSNQIALIVTSTNGVNSVNAGVIVDAINNSNVTISANRVNISGSAVFSELQGNINAINNKLGYILIDPSLNNDAGLQLVNITASNNDNNSRRYTSTTGNPQIIVNTGGISGADYTNLIIRFRYNSGTWKGKIYVSTPSITFNEGSSITIEQPPIGQWITTTISASNFSTNLYSVYTSSVISAIRFDLTSSLNSSVDIDYIIIGNSSLLIQSAINTNASKTVTDNFTVINGGLITSNAIQLGSGGVINSGINGTGSSSSDVRFWAGNTFANRAIAEFRVLDDGSLYATKANITGNILCGGTTNGSNACQLANGRVSVGRILGGSLATSMYFEEKSLTITAWEQGYPDLVMDYSGLYDSLGFLVEFRRSTGGYNGYGANVYIKDGITQTQTFKDGTGVTKTMTIRGGIITAIV